MPLPESSDGTRAGGRYAIAMLPVLLWLPNLLAAPGCGFAPCPSWPQTWNITRSTIIMPCNYSGYFDYKIAGRFAVVDYDWSNAKEMWANPGRHGGGLSADGKMDCEERLLQQAAMTKAHAKSLGIDQQVWVYRNLVKGKSCTVITGGYSCC